MNNKIIVTGAAGILKYVPHMLGIQPKDSIVLVTLTGPLLGATLRMDSPTPGRDVRSFGQTLTSFVCKDESADANSSTSNANTIDHLTGRYSLANPLDFTAAAPTPTFKTQALAMPRRRCSQDRLVR